MTDPTKNPIVHLPLSTPSMSAEWFPARLTAAAWECDAVGMARAAAGKAKTWGVYLTMLEVNLCRFL